jgi:hypothetical protein
MSSVGSDGKSFRAGASKRCCVLAHGQAAREPPESMASNERSLALEEPLA